MSVRLLRLTAVPAKQHRNADQQGECIGHSQRDEQTAANEGEDMTAHGS